MAGICGIIQKKRSADKKNDSAALERMLSKLSATPDQKSVQLLQDSISVGKIFRVSESNENGLIHNQLLSIYCLVEGLVYLDDSEKEIIRNEYGLGNISSTHEYIPYLYGKYAINFVHHLTGWFNIFLFDSKENQAILVNDRLGFLPIFIYDSAEQFIFATKIDCILASGLIRKLEFDLVSLTEQFQFNYPLSDHSLIKNITTLPAATTCQIKPEGSIKSSYWSPGSLIVRQPLLKYEGLESINQALETAVNKVFNNHKGTIAVALTGGWDCRLVLSYALNKYNDRIQVFSFGNNDSPDVRIPQTIANKEGFKYQSYLLDKSYLENYFPDFARKTIIRSNGVRGYRRAPYMYTMESLSTISNLILSGNFGDETFKFSSFKPCEVQSDALINYMISDFKERPNFIYQIFKESYLSGTQRIDLIDEWNSRLQKLEIELSAYNTLSEKYNHLKLTRIANRFFGYEVNSYNDYMDNFSPFIDFDFITAFSKTMYSGIYHPFNENKLRDKEMTSLLYATLIKRNSKNLANYTTDRNYSMSDVASPIGKFSVYFKRYFSKNATASNLFSLDPTSGLFETQHQLIYPETFDKYLQYPDGTENSKVNRNHQSRIQSLNYWMSHITNEYSL